MRLNERQSIASKETEFAFSQMDIFNYRVMDAQMVHAHNKLGWLTLCPNSAGLFTVQCCSKNGLNSKIWQDD